MIQLNKKLILASKSPRRKELLAGLQVAFEVRTKDTLENFPADMPVREVATFLSKVKADAMKDEIQLDEIIISADTVVLYEGVILGKPDSAGAAKLMLRTLSGQVHEVITGVTIMDTEKSVTFEDIAQVTFAQLSEEEINFYVENYSPFDKAGAYGIQEWLGYIGVEKIEGSFYTVMGLPVHKLYAELKNF
jgi:septum formation protein